MAGERFYYARATARASRITAITLGGASAGCVVLASPLINPGYKIMPPPIRQPTRRTRPAQVRTGLAAGGRRIRTLGPPPEGDSIFSRPPRNPTTTNRPGSQNRILTIDKGRSTVRRVRLVPAMISTPGHWLPEGANAGPCQPGRYSGSSRSRQQAPRAWRVGGGEVVDGNTQPASSASDMRVRLLHLGTVG